MPKLSPVMTPDELLSLAGNPQFIPGIYNYCDRWCERCSMTHKCMLFASTPPDESAAEGSPEAKGQAMARQLENSFQLTIDLLNKIASEKGIDLASETETETPLADYETIENELKKSALSRLAKEYLDRTHRWLKTCDAVVNAKDEDLQQANILQLPGRNPEQESAEIKDAFDVVHWYYVQIMVKLSRAQSSRISENKDPEEAEQYPRDSDGSAKVTLIGIERSIGAWGILLRHLPDEETRILDILSILQQLLRMTEEEFPDARSFYRPGLDGVERYED